MRRFTQRELSAIAGALNIILASEVVDGYDEDSEEEADVRAAMQSALEKVWERQR